VIRGHHIKLDPTVKQTEFFWRCFGIARKAFNVALEEWQKQHTAGDKPNEYALLRWLNARKKAEFPYMLEVPCGVIKQAVKNLGTAYQNFFASCKGKRVGARMAPPDFKNKHRAKPSARLDNGPGTFSFDGCAARLPTIGWVKTHEELRFAGKPLSAIVSFVGGRWWLSVQVELPDAIVVVDPLNAVGIDLGLMTALTLSTGDKIAAPKPLEAALERIKRLGRLVSRKVKGSENRRKAVQRISRAHWRVAQIRKDFQHKTTTAIAKRFSLVCVESLNVKGMMQNRSLARAISDVGWYEMVRQLRYKCDAVQEVGRFFASSKLCSKCGLKREELSLSERSWTCACGAIHDRDENAAVNIVHEGEKLYTASCVGINACGVEGSGPRRKTGTKPSTVKQELDRSCKATT
jgi:putative transposase